MRKIYISLILVIVLAALFAGYRYDEGKEVEPVVTVFVTREGFYPADITVRKGEAVRFLNAAPDTCHSYDAGCFFWPASDPHPLHDAYSAFDPLEPLNPGDSWIFTFKKTGVWGYHDHLHSRGKGTVTVTD